MHLLSLLIVADVLYNVVVVLSDRVSLAVGYNIVLILDLWLLLFH